MAKTVAVAEQQTNTGVQQIKSLPERISSFLRDVRSEMRKVVWPNRADVQSMTVVVIVTVFVFAAYFWLVDNVIGRAVEAVLGAATK
ncbi:preprotein translocase subunit SecE [Edaphobacter albus]|uniref:preprotein translocase subunit SecE n=1 Tax=Edaphobacter sp. 4G125 TaxID=2763071 RepID=UPI001644E507|nr:preprotein translocase subunit SecE [Edaphobacter sp. 4G125]QNI36150.1 preprotein translocase subunit SecE [Edaphobacter sp. 4G125]